MQIKQLFMMVMMIPMTALANTSLNQEDVVGDWRCTYQDDEVTLTELMQYRADGTAVEMLEGRYIYPYHEAIEVMLLKYRWHLEGNRLYMSDDQLLKYDYYHYIAGMPLQSDELTTAEMRAGILQSFEDNAWHYIEFDGKDRHRYTFEDGFSGDCQRLK